MNGDFKHLEEIIENRSGAIAYKPSNNEIDYKNSPLPTTLWTDCTIIPSEKNSDPYEWANVCISMYKNKLPSILIPGRKFDITGTRHGQELHTFQVFRKQRLSVNCGISL
ncbi:hypothetical protein KW783_01550 [Candidatus Parcubacteria bacterium]|nr:hypothetical protein [Candidatus Parcubacteria bacterium]